MFDFFASVVYIEEHNNRHVGGIDDDDYEAWNSNTACTEILLPTESSAQPALQSKCVFNTSKFDEHAYISVRRSDWNSLQACRNRELELQENVSDLQVQVNELSINIARYQKLYLKALQELHQYEIEIRELHKLENDNQQLEKQLHELKRLDREVTRIQGTQTQGTQTTQNQYRVDQIFTDTI